MNMNSKRKIEDLDNCSFGKKGICARRIRKSLRRKRKKKRSYCADTITGM